MSAPPENTNTNRLIGETSPYLLQHAHNPVAWFPWGEEALEKSRDEDKPILLSVGYSACHWCHVMERESFENDEIAALMNEHFIPVKVDREERPDIDEIYMNAVQMMTGSGGWPLTVFLTPRLKPFYGGTYFPPDDRLGRPGFKSVLTELARVYEQERGRIQETSEALTARLQTLSSTTRSAEILTGAVIGRAARELGARFDAREGGFSTAPKFPPSGSLSLLLRHQRTSRNPEELHMVELTLDKMAAGGMYDQLGGGFHRYSTDERWLVPHFEKMLYDNALLVPVYLEAHQVTGKSEYRRIARESLEWVLREMQDDTGGYYSTQDADSEGVEGKFYVWSKDEVSELLGDDAQKFCAAYDVTGDGNWEGSNILHLPEGPGGPTVCPRGAPSSTTREVNSSPPATNASIPVSTTKCSRAGTRSWSSQWRGATAFSATHGFSTPRAVPSASSNRLSTMEIGCWRRIATGAPGSTLTSTTTRFCLVAMSSSSNPISTHVGSSRRHGWQPR